MIKEEVINQIKELTNCKFLEVVLRGNSAITVCMSLVKKKLLIPEEGGWIHYKRAPQDAKLEFELVKCNLAKIDLEDLEQKTKKADVFLYENPGGYFAEEPIEEIYKICKANDCLVILDISGSIGTKYADTKNADVIIGSFGRWKPINAEAGGFVASNNEELWQDLSKHLHPFEDEVDLEKIKQRILNLEKRLQFLLEMKKKVIEDLSDMQIVHRNDYGLVVIVKYSTEEEMKKIINYCDNNKLPYTECPRYIRLNQKAISIEIKKL